MAVNHQMAEKVNTKPLVERRRFITADKRFSRACLFNFLNLLRGTIAYSELCNLQECVLLTLYGLAG